MDCEAAFGFDNPMGVYGLPGRHVHRAHEPFGFVGSDRKEGKARTPETCPDLLEMRSECRVGCEVDRASRRFEPIPAPKRSIAIIQAAGGEVVGGDTCDGAVALPPIQFRFGSDPVPIQNCGDAERNEEAGVVNGRDAFEGCDIQVVVVIVAEQNEVDLRQAFEGEAGRDETLRTSPGEWAGTIAPDGVCEDIQASMLNEER